MTSRSPFLRRRLVMGEIGFFMLQEEENELLQWLIDRGFVFVRAEKYESPAVEELSSVNDIRNRSLNLHFFLVRHDLLKSSLVVKRASSTTSSIYYIEPTTGGPLLQLYLGLSSAVEGRPRISAGELSYYPRYENSKTGRVEKLEGEVLKLYRECARFIRKGRQRIQPTKRAYWASRAVADFVGSGGALLYFENLSVDQIFGSASH